MFEYTKLKLIDKISSTKIWKIAALLALSHAVFTVYGSISWLLQLASSASILIFIFWLVITLKQATWKQLASKIIPFILCLLAAALLIGFLFGLMAVLLHQLMSGTHSLGQITTVIDFLIRMTILLLTPLLIVIFFRLIGGKAIRAKIQHKLYLELLAVLTVALILAQIPNTLVLGHLNMIHLVQLLLLGVINTLLIITIITTCQRRGELTWKNN